jgi:3-oxoacyl-(acyl-carrier-protein) synthase
MENVFIGPSHSLSYHGMSDGEIFDSLLANNSPLDGISSLLESALENKIVGRIPWDEILKHPIKNGCVNNGPIEARYAYVATRLLLEEHGLVERVQGQETGLYVGTMNNWYGLVGLRNGYRICANSNLEYEKEVFESRIGTGFSYVHPMVPVYKIPNNVIANLALDYEISGENANYFGEDSGSVAIQESYVKIRNGLLPRCLAINSVHLFVNYLDFFFLEIHNFSKKNPQFCPEKDSVYYPSEWAGAFLFMSEAEVEKSSLTPRARVLSGVQFSYLEKYFQRTLPPDVLSAVVDKGLRAAGLSWKDLDLLLFDNFAEEQVQLNHFLERNQKDKASVILLSPSLLCGHPICATGSTHLGLALSILDQQKVFSSYLKGQVPKNPRLTSKAESAEVKKIGILTQSLNNALHFMVLEKV